MERRLEQPIGERFTKTSKDRPDRLATNAAKVLTPNRSVNLPVTYHMHRARGPEDWVTKGRWQIEVKSPQARCDSPPAAIHLPGVTNRATAKPDATGRRVSRL